MDGGEAGPKLKKEVDSEEKRKREGGTGIPQLGRPSVSGCLQQGHG